MFSVAAGLLVIVHVALAVIFLLFTIAIHVACGYCFLSLFPFFFLER